MRRDIAALLRANLTRGFLESEERFRQLADALHDVVALSDPHFTRFLFVSAAFERIWGQPRGEVLRDPMAYFAAVHPDDRDRVRTALTRSEENGLDVEFRIVRPDGDPRWIWMRGYPIRDSGADASRMASIAEDITDRKQIAASHEGLVRGFTHDVKNPLGAVDGYLSLLEAGVMGELSPAQSEGVARARRSLHSALVLITQLLEIERAQSGSLRVELQSVNLADAVDDVVAEFRAAAAAKQLHMTMVGPGPGAWEPLVVESDRLLVRQILANLISNAVKYTQPGGRIGIRTELAAASQGRGNGPMACVSVMDNGPGIPLEKQRMVFREFARFTPDAVEGSGVGLAISQRIAHAIGGSLAFESTPGVGSTFTLWLPYNPPGISVA